MSAGKKYIAMVIVEIVRDDGKVLTETKQTFHPVSSNDRPYTTTRHYRLAEKALPNETLRDVVRRVLLKELGIVREHVKHQTLLDFDETYTEEDGVIYMYRRYKAIIKESDLGLAIPDGYRHTEYLANGSPHVTTTWNWL